MPERASAPETMVPIEIDDAGKEGKSVVVLLVVVVVVVT